VVKKNKKKFLTNNKVCAIIKIQRRGKHLKEKEIITMTINHTIRNEWYEEIKDLVPTANPEFYGNMVEVDVLDEVKFEEVSKELGWMV
jgi:hypothetical protein